MLKLVSLAQAAGADPADRSHASLFAQALARALATRLAELDRPDRTPQEQAELERLRRLLAGRGRIDERTRGAA